MRSEPVHTDEWYSTRQQIRERELLKCDAYREGFAAGQAAERADRLARTVRLECEQDAGIDRWEPGESVHVR